MNDDSNKHRNENKGTFARHKRILINTLKGKHAEIIEIVVLFEAMRLKYSTALRLHITPTM